MNIAIVTGASSGMGREFVLQLSEYVKVDEIWVVARRLDALESLKEEVSIPVRPIALDLCEAESFDTIAKLLEVKWWDLPDEEVEKLLPDLVAGNVDSFVEKAGAAWKK